MAMTHDYLDYLNQRVGIAPANSQEELQAAQTIAGLMSHHDVEPSVEEFDAPVLSGLFPAILSILMFVGVLVSGVGVVALTVIGFLLAIIPALLAALRLFGRAPSLSFGPSARSQNVIAVHRASGPLVAKGNRPIVVVAHYDTPRENFLYSMPFAPYLPLIVKVAVMCRYAVALCALIQVMGFIPAPARLVFWLVGIIASLPAVLLAAGSIYERVSPCTLGANDNKASVAALLGVMENVRPSGLVPLPREPERPKADDAEAEAELDEVEESPEAEEAAVEAAPAPVSEPAFVEVPAAPAPEPVKVVGVRHGEDVLRSLDILPEGCEIEYVTPEAAPAPAPVAAPVSLFDIDPLPEPEDEEPEEEPYEEAEETLVEQVEPADEDEAADIAAEAEEDSIEGTAPLAAVPAADEPEAETTREDLLSGGRFSLVMDEGDRGVGPKDSSGLTAIDEGSLDPDATQPAPETERPRPSAPEDPEWGTSTYRPQVSSVARRASLFDLPDPSLNESDPLGDPNATRVAPSRFRFGRTSEPAPETASEQEVVEEQASEVSAPEAIETLASTAERGKSVLSGLVDRIKGALSKKAEKGAEDEEPAGDWLGSSDDSDDPVWKGGAAVRGGLRFVDEDEAAPTEEEMVEEVLSLGDDALICHDVWFVALGGSSLDHAGMRSFLQQHRQEIRGSFIVNLDCVGAGELSVLTHEGVEGTRRADRRLGRILTGVAHDLHTDLVQKSFDWTSTDALPAMSSSMRSVTIMGVNELGLPALSHTADDVAENVSGDQATLVTEIVTEAIRRA